jgi:hypothetical protein
MNKMDHDLAKTSTFNWQMIPKTTKQMNKAMNNSFTSNKKNWNINHKTIKSTNEKTKIVEKNKQIINNKN